VQLAREFLDAKPLNSPMIDRNLATLSVIERAAEVLRYTARKTEYWLSPGGFLRAVLRRSFQLALLLGLPALIAGPVVLLVLEDLAAASRLLAQIAESLAVLSFWLIAAVFGFAGLAGIGRAIIRRK
jgi:hypothetical protein